MAFEVRLGKLSPTMETGTINRWLKKEGDKISSGDTLAEVETDKASMPLEVFEDGKLLKILVGEGKTAKIDELLAIIGNEGEDISKLVTGGGAPAPKAAAPAKGAAQAASPAASPVVVQGSSHAASSGRIKASPLAKKIAKERGVDLGAVKPSGPGGRIVVRDVPERGAAPAAATGAGMAQPVLPGAMLPGDSDEPLSNIRQTIARRLLQSKQTIPHFYLYSEVNLDRLTAMREDLNAQQGEKGVKISINDFIIKMTAAALSRHPEVNAAFNGTSIRRFGSINIAIAVATDAGLYTPVLRNVDKLSLSGISAGVKDIAAKAREKKLRAEDLQGSGFTISNLGMFGVDHFFAIINPPEAAILAVGAMKPKPIVNAAGQIVVGKMMGLTLSCDHRVIDGAVGAKFMATLKELLENPAKLLL
ncbi:MAG TPA: pyruvate dehydrogenase complex dihydrolipoamide acetyltransferase [Planctomycetota bacterium]|nr:pyruvate dehydrogenase complex dihydrolipoamide acetyltransferase [Planctomycetota bacterium]